MDQEVESPLLVGLDGILGRGEESQGRRGGGGRSVLVVTVAFLLGPVMSLVLSQAIRNLLSIPYENPSLSYSHSQAVTYTS